MSFFIVTLSVLLGACSERDVGLDTDFEIPRDEMFKPLLSDYGFFEGALKELNPSDNVHLYELNAQLFTDYASKQRLLYVPEGQAVTFKEGAPLFPEGSVLLKTFYFHYDMRDPAQGRRIVETRLMIKTAWTWNVATYVWNEGQTEATLTLQGAQVPVSWLDQEGQTRSAEHEVPSEVACVTCHQSRGVVSPIGPQLKNLNRVVERDGATVEQLERFSALGVLDMSGDEEALQGSPMVSPDELSASLEARARSYLDVNCAHCHNPHAWDRSANQELDLRYDTPLPASGIVAKKRRLQNQLRNGEMPFVGTTLLHEEGVALVIEYLSTL